MKHILILLLFVSSLGFSQSSGITYQAVIYNPNGEELPGIDNPYAPLINQDVCLQFGIVDADGNLEYQEDVQVTTDAFGMVNLLIGTNTQTGGYAADFAGIEWTADSKFLKVDLDIKGTCNDFEELSNQPFTYVPFAYYSPASDVPGPEGPAGADGQDGNDGQDGATGPAGPTGQAGPAGPNGQDGSTGPAGPSGPEGSQGPAGPSGADGEAGIKTLINTSDEAAGDNCANGGVKIEVGEDTNADGILDTDEVDDSLTRYVCNGVDGEDGAVGPQGIQGIQGDTGAQGLKGDKGDTGDTGAVGPQGIQGIQGDTGAQGLKGDTGAVGPQGIQGIQGEPGTSAGNGLSSYPQSISDYQICTSIVDCNTKISQGFVPLGGVSIDESRGGTGGNTYSLGISQAMIKYPNQPLITEYTIGTDLTDILSKISVGFIPIGGISYTESRGGTGGSNYSNKTYQAMIKM